MKREKVGIHNGGCWFCDWRDDNLIPEHEFDTFVHIECLKDHKCHEMCECSLMAYLLDTEQETE